MELAVPNTQVGTKRTNRAIIESILLVVCMPPNSRLISGRALCTPLDKAVRELGSTVNDEMGRRFHDQEKGCEKHGSLERCRRGETDVGVVVILIRV